MGLAFLESLSRINTIYMGINSIVSCFRKEEFRDILEKHRELELRLSKILRGSLPTGPAVSICIA